MKAVWSTRITRRRRPAPERESRFPFPYHSNPFGASMLKPIVLIIFLVGIPFGLYLALQYGEITTVTFAEAVEMARGKTEAELTKKIMIKGHALIDENHTIERGPGVVRFYMRDETMQDFLVSYDGTDEFPPLEHMQRIAVAGHAHDGNPPWFHCKDVETGY